MTRLLIWLLELVLDLELGQLMALGARACPLTSPGCSRTEWMAEQQWLPHRPSSNWQTNP